MPHIYCHNHIANAKKLEKLPLCLHDVEAKENRWKPASASATTMASSNTFSQCKAYFYNRIYGYHNFYWSDSLSVQRTRTHTIMYTINNIKQKNSRANRSDENMQYPINRNYCQVLKDELYPIDAHWGASDDVYLLRLPKTTNFLIWLRRNHANINHTYQTRQTTLNTIYSNVRFIWAWFIFVDQQIPKSTDRFRKMAENTFLKPPSTLMGFG